MLFALLRSSQIVGNPHQGIAGVLSRPVMALAPPSPYGADRALEGFYMRKVEDDRPRWRAGRKRMRERSAEEGIHLRCSRSP